MSNEEHTHEDGTTHSHEGGAIPHTHEKIVDRKCVCREGKRNRQCLEHGG